MLLSKRNAHARDAQSVFSENGHKYTILTDPKSKYTSVTTWVHSHFPKFDADAVIQNMMKGRNWKEGHKYWDMTPKQIKDSWTNNASSVANAGTDLHARIEMFMNASSKVQAQPTSILTHAELDGFETNLHEPDVVEWHYFLDYVHSLPHLRPYRTEWMVYEEDLKLAGSIDMVYENDDGTLSIYDWKRSKEISAVNSFNRYAVTQCISHMPDSNFWHYALQLNTYKTILERKYGKTVKELFLVRLHPDNNPEETYELISVPILVTEMETLVAEMMIKKRA